MTTSKTPLRTLTKQAEDISFVLKSVARGVIPTDKRFAKLAEARKERTDVKFAIAMDDKLITVEIPWSKIEETSETNLTVYILKLMKNERNHS